MFFAKIPRHTRQNAITEGDLECILTRNCEGTEQLRKKRKQQFYCTCHDLYYLVMPSACPAWHAAMEDFSLL